MSHARTCQLAARRGLEKSCYTPQVLGWSIEERGRRRSACLSQTSSCLAHEIRQPLQLCLHSIAQDLSVQTQLQIIKVLRICGSPSMIWLLFSPASSGLANILSQAPEGLVAGGLQQIQRLHNFSALAQNSAAARRPALSARAGSSFSLITSNTIDKLQIGSSPHIFLQEPRRLEQP